MLRYIVDRLLLWGIGGVLALAILGAGVLWLAFRDHHHPRTVREDLTRLYDGARAYYLEAEVGDGDAAKFAQPSTGFVPELGECCRQGGECKPDPALWEAEPWASLMFAIERSQRYSFAYRVAADQRSFTVTAHGDLDCDGDYSTFEMVGEVAGGGLEGGRPALFRQDELE